MLDTDPLKANIDYAIADRSEERVSGGTGGYDKASLASYFGRLDYNFDERYMIQFTLRRDGSSVFGTNNKWATFPCRISWLERAQRALSAESEAQLVQCDEDPCLLGSEW